MNCFIGNGQESNVIYSILFMQVYICEKVYNSVSSTVEPNYVCYDEENFWGQK